MPDLQLMGQHKYHYWGKFTLYPQTCCRLCSSSRDFPLPAVLSSTFLVGFDEDKLRTFQMMA